MNIYIYYPFPKFFHYLRHPLPVLVSHPIPLSLSSFIPSADQVADGQQAKKAASPMTAVCKSFAQLAIDLGQGAMLRSLKPLRSALEKLQDTPEPWG